TLVPRPFRLLRAREGRSSSASFLTGGDPGRLTIHVQPSFSEMISASVPRRRPCSQRDSSLQPGIPKAYLFSSMNVVEVLNLIHLYTTRCGMSNGKMARGEVRRATVYRVSRMLN